MIDEFYIEHFTTYEIERLQRISAKFEKGRRYSKADRAFDKWYNAEVTRRHQEAEELKSDGWSRVHNSSLSLEERMRGAEMVMYSHYWRAKPHPPMTPEQYAGCWLEANGNDLLRYPELIAMLRKRYPFTGSRRLKPGYTYVWEEEGTQDADQS